MKLIDAPGKHVLPFANAGSKNIIPTASQIGITAGAASYTDGFPPLTRTPLTAGGTPPSGLDMNGFAYEISAITRWASSGAGFTYDSVFSTDANVGGYPLGARVLRTDGKGYWLNLTDDNVTDPEGVGAVAAGWVPDFTNGVSAITMTGANVTLTALEYGKPIIVISGLLTADLSLIFPDLVGDWVVVNNTTGAFSITCKTSAGTGVIIQFSEHIVGDGTNVLRAVPLSIGYNQSWQDVTVSRSLGTTYYNTTGQPISVNVRARTTDVLALYLRVDGVEFRGTSGVADTVLRVSGIIPAGASYLVSVPGTPTLWEWVELR